MDKSLISIRGIDEKTVDKLAKQEINTLDDLLEKAGTPEQRKTLAKSMRVSANSLNLWVKQAELMRIEGITAYEADLLTKIGIRNLTDLSKANTATLVKLIKTYKENYPTAEEHVPIIEELDRWKSDAAKLAGKITNNPGEAALDLLFEDRIIRPEIPDPDSTGGSDSQRGTAEDSYITTPDEFFHDMTDIIVNLGTGIAKAQQALDLNAIETQKIINDDEDLRLTGLMANWYTIPEVTFNLKMNYSVAKEQTTDRTSEQKRIMISPINARYQNCFKVSEDMQSELNIRFVPIPPPTQYIQVIYVPDFTGKSLDEAKPVLKDLGLVLGEIVVVAGSPEGGKDTEIKEQTVKAGDEARFNDKIGFKVVKKEGAVIG